MHPAITCCSALTWRTEDFDLVALWNSEQSRIEMRLRARASSGRTWPSSTRKTLEAGQEMLTEISTKFRLPDLRVELAGHQLETIRAWVDAAGDHSLILARAR